LYPAPRADNSAVLVAMKVKVRMEAPNSIPLSVFITLYGKALPLDDLGADSNLTERIPFLL
jgi:hypothetical protein